MDTTDHITNSTFVDRPDVHLKLNEALGLYLPTSKSTKNHQALDSHLKIQEAI